MRFFALLALGASAQFTSVTFTNYDDEHCLVVNETVVRPLGTCIKEKRVGHYRMLHCSENGEHVTDVEYDDADCTHKVFGGDIIGKWCHGGRARSTIVRCDNTLLKQRDLFVMPEATWPATAKPEHAFMPANYTSAKDCVTRDFATWCMAANMPTQYAQYVCGAWNNFRCDCSGAVSCVSGGPAPGWVTSQMPGVSFRLNQWPDLWNGDIILRPDEHVEQFTSYDNRAANIYRYCGCHNSAAGCDCRGGTNGYSYWQSNGFYPAHLNSICIPP
jgi:hypothetical protein